MPAPAYAIDAIQAPIAAAVDVWHVTAAPAFTITYAFETQQSSEFLRIYTGWTAWTDDQKAAVRWALREYESVANVRFVEVAAGVGADPDIAFGRVDLDWGGETWWRYGYGIDESGQVVGKNWDAGVVWDNERDLTAAAARYVLLHEIGHALFMKHPGDYDVTGSATPGPFLPEAEDHGAYTVMSYNRVDGGADARQLQLYDIAALQARWGANTTEAAGDNVYTFADDPGVFAIWDTGGTDRIDAAAAAGAADIDLAEGAFSWLAGQARISVAWGVQIEDATGGASADRLRGNGLANHLTGGPGGDTIEGGAGTDYLRGEEGDDVIQGGSDFDDTHGNMGNDTVSGGGGDDWVVGGKDNDALYGETGGDVVWGNLGNDTCEGGDGADQVRGGQGDDVIRGGAGDDWLSGDRGTDTITGGSGADIFHTFDGAGADRVTDFNAAEGDRVYLLPGAQYTAAQVGADTVITVTGQEGGTLTLVGVQLSTLTTGWIFGA